MSLPLENLDNKTFEEFVEEAKKRIPIYAPRWTDFNLHDPGITLIELFAWLVEMQVYRLNQITNHSKWKFLKLTGIPEPPKSEDRENKEKLETAIRDARKDMKAVSRAVTSEDYQILALRTPKVHVARAKAIPGYHPNLHCRVPGIVTVIVVPAAQNPGPNILDSVFQHIDKHRLLTTTLFVTLPLYIEVAVQAAVVVKPEYLERTVIKKVTERLARFLHPLTGGSDGNGWPFGRPVYVSEIYRVIDRTDGVDYVETGSVRLKKEYEDWQKHDIHIPRHGLVCPGVHDISVSFVSSIAKLIP